MIDLCKDSDIPAVAELLRDLNALHARHLPDRFHCNGPQAAIAGFLSAQRARGAQILVYRAGGAPRGYLMWMGQERDRTALQAPRHRAILDHIYVEPSWRRRGMASRLIARFEADIAKAGFAEWSVQVHDFNAASLALMRRHGALPSVHVMEKGLERPPVQAL